MVNTRTFAGIDRGSLLAIEVRQEGDRHAVRGRLEHDGTVDREWMKGELEDRRTTVTLDASGLYQLSIYVAFFGRDEERVTITVAIQTPYGEPLHEHRLDLAGRSGDMQAFVAVVSVNG